MADRKVVRSAVLVASVCALSAPRIAAAQASNYPSFQHPHIVSREWNFGVAEGGAAGPHFVAQWREQLRGGVQLIADGGLSDPDFGRLHVLMGAALGFRVLQSTEDVPLDLMLTAGAYAAFGSPYNFFRFPFGATVGHRFPLQGQLALTPYVHPRLSIDFCSSDAFCGNSSELSVNFEVGSDLELTRRVSLRAAFLFTGSDAFRDDIGFGISLAWRPPALAATATPAP